MLLLSKKSDLLKFYFVLELRSFPLCLSPQFGCYFPSRKVKEQEYELFNEESRSNALITYGYEHMT